MKIMIMKVEKDNAMDRSDVCEQAAKDAKVNITKYKIKKNKKNHKPRWTSHSVDDENVDADDVDLMMLGGEILWWDNEITKIKMKKITNDYRRIATKMKHFQM